MTADMAGKHGLWNFLDRLKGDKVVWLIALILFLLLQIEEHILQRFLLVLHGGLCGFVVRLPGLHLSL